MLYRYYIYDNGYTYNCDELAIYSVFGFQIRNKIYNCIIKEHQRVYNVKKRWNYCEFWSKDIFGNFEIIEKHEIFITRIKT